MARLPSPSCSPSFLSQPASEFWSVASVGQKQKRSPLRVCAVIPVHGCSIPPPSPRPLLPSQFYFPPLIFDPMVFFVSLLFSLSLVMSSSLSLLPPFVVLPSCFSLSYLFLGPSQWANKLQGERDPRGRVGPHGGGRSPGGAAGGSRGSKGGGNSRQRYLCSNSVCSCWSPPARLL